MNDSLIVDYQPGDGIPSVYAYARWLVTRYGGVVWPLWETSGAVVSSFPAGYEGIYQGGYILNQSAAPTRLKRGVSIPVLGAQINVFSAALAALFNANTGFLGVFFKPNAATFWNDAINHYPAHFFKDAGVNRIQLRRVNGTPNAISAIHTGVNNSRPIVSMNWSFQGVSWNVPGLVARHYLNDGGVNFAIAVAIGLPLNTTVFGAYGSGLEPSLATLACGLLLTGIPQPAEILNLQRLAGVI